MRRIQEDDIRELKILAGEFTEIGNYVEDYIYGEPTVPSFLVSKLKILIDKDEEIQETFELLNSNGVILVADKGWTMRYDGDKLSDETTTILFSLLTTLFLSGSIKDEFYIHRDYLMNMESIKELTNKENLGTFLLNMGITRELGEELNIVIEEVKTLSKKAPSDSFMVYCLILLTMINLI